MAVGLYDTLARKIVPLETREPGRVYMYVCGPTVYNYVHIGNARTFLWFDFIRRYLAYRGYDVTYVMNYTDVDDRIIERAGIEGVPTEAITSKYEVAFEADMAPLGLAPPDILCRATQHVDDMIKAIEGLIEKGVAYEAAGNVWFAVESFSAYGRLSGRSLDDMRAGERVEPHASKRHPLDFALWRAAAEDEPAWESPWGPGRPGWHIECSVMSTKYLGMGFDIHGGGVDLIFPHHENEIAQAEALADGETFVRHWIHSAHVLMEAEKMSKSLGNVVLAREAVERFPPDAVRYWALMASYRTQVSFSQDSLEDARNSYGRWKTFYESARHVLGARMPELAADPVRPVDEDGTERPPHVQRFIDVMDDDFNTAAAFAVVHELVREGNRSLDAAQRGDGEQLEELTRLTEQFLELMAVLGLRLEAPLRSSQLLEGLIDYMLELREEARRERAFERADTIRAKLTKLGVVIEDTPAGPRWRLDAAAG